MSDLDKMRIRIWERMGLKQDEIDKELFMKALSRDYTRDKLPLWVQSFIDTKLFDAGDE